MEYINQKTEFIPGKYRIYCIIVDKEDPTNNKIIDFIVEANSLEELQSHYYEKGVFLRVELVEDK